MSNNTTIARPYAKAIFNIARDSKQLGAWSLILKDLALAVVDADAARFICNPASTASQHSQLLLAVISHLKSDIAMPVIENLINMLAGNKRLLLLPDIFVQFESLRAEQEKTLVVHVVSFAALSEAQQKQLIVQLNKRLERSVTLDLHVDPTLIGGAIIRAGDLVINGSVKDKLNKLVTNLAA